MPNDWMRKAAEALAKTYNHPSRSMDSYVTDEQRAFVADEYERIIRRHALVTEAEGFMPVPRCDGCVFWDKNRGVTINQSICHYPTDMTINAKMWPDQYDAIWTEADFGCTEWKAK